ncbi:MAG: hypothetical protein LAQ69_42470 [Acidobacteriia bacterium]|nr:hypothetical protein [Terriglobia bacterium]
MKSKSIHLTCVFARLAALLLTVAVAGEDKFTLKAPNGIASFEFRGCDARQSVAPSCATVIPTQPRRQP